MLIGRSNRRRMGRAGLEHPTNAAGNTGVSETGGNKSGNIGPVSGDPIAPATPPATPTDPELAAVAAAWPTLPPAIRAGIVAMVAAAGPAKPPAAEGAR